MLNHLYRTALWSIILTVITDQAVYSFPAVLVPTAPSLTNPNSQKMQTIDEPFCFMRTSSGKFVNLEHLCNPEADIKQRNRAGVDQSSSSNPVRFGAGKGYAEDSR